MGSLVTVDDSSEEGLLRNQEKILPNPQNGKPGGLIQEEETGRFRGIKHLG